MDEFGGKRHFEILRGDSNINVTPYRWLEKIVKNLSNYIEENREIVIVATTDFWYFRNNALESVNETPSNDEDKPEMFKRTPWRLRFFRRRGLRTWGRRLKDKFKNFGKKIHGGAKKFCGWLKNPNRKCKSYNLR